MGSRERFEALFHGMLPVAAKMPRSEVTTTWDGPSSRMTVDGAGSQPAGDVREGRLRVWIFRITPKPGTKSNVAEENGTENRVRRYFLRLQIWRGGWVFHGGPTLSSERSP